MHQGHLVVPHHRTCGVLIAHNRLLEADPTARERRARLKADIGARIMAADAFAAAGPVTIGVVVHVVYSDEAGNISDAQVASQIDAMNRDYSRSNADAVHAPGVWKGLQGDAKIRFKLATRDPAGGPTNGITRTSTQVTQFSTDDSVKFSARGGADAWDSTKYLNLWVCNLGDGLLGYAQFPGMPAETDGVVILNQAFGTVGNLAPEFNQGRTAVHECGHWLDLHHIWGDTTDCSGSDLVADTPTQQLPNYGVPAFPHVSCSNGPNGDMFMNYMDYVDDAAMVMFTAGQIARMHSTLQGPRASVVAAAATVAV
jgi:hypothetical protein